jgi:hypothetical protein
VTALSFGAPVIDPAGKHARHCVDGRQPGREPATHSTDELMNVGEGLHGKQRVDATEPTSAHSGNVVAHQIDDHQVLGVPLTRC